MLTKEEYTRLVEEQVRIKMDADVEIKRLRQEYIDSAPIKVGDIVKLSNGIRGNNPAEDGEEVRVSKVTINHLDKIAVEFVNRKKKDGTWSNRDEHPWGGVIKDGVYYPTY